MKKDIKKTIQIPSGYEIIIQEKRILVKKGNEEIKIPFKIKNIKPKIENNEFIIEKKLGNKTEKKLINALASHLNNAIKGLETKYEYKLQICSVHFPMNSKIEKNKLVIKNFFGERKDRVLEIKPGVEVKINNDIITVTSANKDLAGHQASAIEALTRVTTRDRRVFQDGIWIIKKEKGRG
jgi:large subunit ribosomal protein L6